MKFGTVFALATMFVGASALADTSSYSDLAAMFQTAQQPNAATVSGWYAGYCVGKWDDAAYGTVLTFNHPANAGLFFNTILLKGVDDPAAYQSLSGAQMDEIQSYIDQKQESTITPAYSEDGSLKCSPTYNFWVDYGVHSLRQGNGFFVENVHTQVGKDTYCYFTTQIKK